LNRFNTNLFHTWRRSRENSAAFLALVAIFSCFAAAQTITVDVSHSTNHFVPSETLGAGVDRIPAEAIDKDLLPASLQATLASGWQTVSYRQNTELAVEAWHWNPKGSWSDPKAILEAMLGARAISQGMLFRPKVFAIPMDMRCPVAALRATMVRTTPGSRASPTAISTRSGRAIPISRNVSPAKATPCIRSGSSSIWRSRSPWTAFASRGASPMPLTTSSSIGPATIRLNRPLAVSGKPSSQAASATGKGGTETIRLATTPVAVRFIRIWMTESSNTCDADGPADPRNCVGYSIRELYLGTVTHDGDFHDSVRHTADQEQTTTYCSSVDPWHTASDLGSTRQAQVGFDLFFTSGVTRGLPAMMPVALLYDTPENAVAEIAYLEHRHYPISYVEMGEEADGQYMLPEDYAALYLQWATALHRLDPTLKLGGPSFQGVNKDIEVWPDASGRVSWTARFIDYLKQHGRMKDLAFFSFEHYPYDPCKTPWGVLYDEPELMHHIIQVWHEDGVPADLPMFVTEGNLSSGASETYQDIFSGLWLADYIGSLLDAGGKAVYFFHYLPLQMEPGCNSSPGTFGMFTVDPVLQDSAASGAILCGSTHQPGVGAAGRRRASSLFGGIRTSRTAPAANW
jgi:hypothetical protein